MPGITERDLAEYLAIATEAATKSGKPRAGIDAFSIEEADPDVFHLRMDLTYKGKATDLIGARGKPRIWRDLHRLVNFIRSLDFPEAPISMKLLRGTDENSAHLHKEDDA